MRETLCLADLWINLCTIWTNQAPVSWSTGLPRLCLQDGCWTPRSGHTGSSGQWLGSALPAMAFSLVHFLLTHFSTVFRGLISGGIYWCPLVEYSRPRSPPGEPGSRPRSPPGESGSRPRSPPGEPGSRPRSPPGEPGSFWLLWSWPFPAVLSTCGHNASLDSLDPWCLSAVQATNVSSQVVS